MCSLRSKLWERKGSCVDFEPRNENILLESLNFSHGAGLPVGANFSHFLILAKYFEQQHHKMSY